MTSEYAKNQTMSTKKIKLLKTMEQTRLNYNKHPTQEAVKELSCVEFLDYFGQFTLQTRIGNASLLQPEVENWPVEVKKNYPFACLLNFFSCFFALRSLGESTGFFFSSLRCLTTSFVIKTSLLGFYKKDTILTQFPKKCALCTFERVISEYPGSFP